MSGGREGGGKRRKEEEEEEEEEGGGRKRKEEEGRGRKRRKEEEKEAEGSGIETKNAGRSHLVLQLLPLSLRPLTSPPRFFEVRGCRALRQLCAEVEQFPLHPRTVQAHRLFLLCGAKKGPGVVLGPCPASDGHARSA